MLSLLPDYADPERLCGLGKVYEGCIALNDLPRLSALLADTAGEARFRLAFGVDEKKRGIAQVSVQSVLRVKCQRCLGPLDLPVDAQASLAVVRGPDEAARLPAEIDPLLVTGGPISLLSLVEDELMLAVPNAPMHSDADCPVDLQSVNTAADDPHTRMDTTCDNGPASPFAALATLKRENGSDD
jgi:uncharacterized protein